MKRILFIIDNLNIGGIQKSLVELITAIKGSYDITVLCFDNSSNGNYALPQSIKIIEGDKFLKMSVLERHEFKRKYGTFLSLFRFSLKLFSSYISKKIAKKVICRLSNINLHDYDVAISFSHPVPGNGLYHIENEFLIYNVSAPKKISFLHCDYLAYNNNTAYNKRLYDRIDVVAAVSRSVRECFLKALPEMEDKTQVVYNYCNVKNVRNLSAAQNITYKSTTMVTLARLSAEKGIVRCIAIIKRLKDEGYCFEWHIVGSGEMEQKIKSDIINNGLQDMVILEGAHNNPYPFLTNANYLFIPSYHEAAPMVINEALSLNVPILSTNTLSAKELISDRGIGVVCSNDEESIYNMLKSTLDNPVVIQHNDIEQFNDLSLQQFHNLVK